MKLSMNRITGLLTCMMLVVLTACNDGKKEEQMKMEAEKMEMEAKEKEEMEMKKMEEEKKEMAMNNSIAGKAMANENLSTLVAALKAADLAEMLSEPGDYTVFAPSNNAFEKLPEGTVDNLLKPENKEQLQNILKYHVVSGKMDAESFAKTIQDANGKYTMTTVGGGEITAMMDGDQYMLKDARGNKTQVVLGNVDASNGIAYILNDVLMPKK
ncbi:fasciclin domain-containing protein [Winogradskyella ursingii]|uniref:fasciclin domain-containing protein n=1 Tax=Winogradskyella ursingii TaxID=2686079 RepID=UPI001FEC5F7E|nr:fasciclin domain-containing protein [Winogradskyella ursingii]